jgi:hypothetical protein
MIIIGLIAIKIDVYCDWGVIEFLVVALGIVGLLICIVIISTQHGCTGNIIYNNQIYYDGLCKRLEVVQSDYEDVSKSQVIKDVTEWNMDVYNTKYWSESLWTNWFNPKDIADNMDYIPLE